VGALSLPDRIEISQADDAAVASATPRFGVVAELYSDTGTDYANQEKDTWVDDTDALDMVNQILGAVSDSGYQNFVNQGPYKALIRAVGESDQSQGGSSTTSSTTEDLQTITLNITRASASDPMVVKIWVEEPDGPGGNAMRIRGYFEVSQGVSDEYPYGVIEAHFKGTALDSGGNEGTDLFNMAMSVDADGSGNVVIQFVETGDEGDFSWNNKAHIIASADMSEGTAYAYQYQDSTFGGTSEVTSYFAFNQDYFKEKAGGTTTVYNKNAFFHKVFRYKLFNKETGAAVSMSSGFPIQTAGGDYGYIGYYGLWAPYGVELEDGDTLTRVETGDAYTLVKVGGKLTKHTRSSVQLGDLTGVEMSKYECGGGGCTDYIIAWDGSDFMKIGERGQTGQVTYYSPGARTAVTFQEWEGAWCEPLRAYLRLGTITTPSDSSTVYYHGEETVNPQTVSDMTLYYWGFALDAPITQTVIDNADEGSYWSSPSEKTYTFDSTNLLLKDGDGDALLIGSDLDLSATNWSNGYTMGPLTATSMADLGAADGEETYYMWQTGPNDWNQFATVRDSQGDYVAFTAPLRFSYTHSTANDVNGESTHNGKMFSLEYDGFELRVPWEYDETAGEWQPLLNLKDGTELTDGSTTYVVKGVEEGLMMQEEGDPSVADDLILDETVPPPTLTYDSTKTAQVGAVPTGTELKVIKGEVIE